MEATKAIATQGMKIVSYTPKSFAVIGDTYPHRAELKEMNGSFVKFLKIDGASVPGWCFSLSREMQVRKWLMQVDSPRKAPKEKKAPPKGTKKAKPSKAPAKKKALPVNLEAMIKAEVEKRLGTVQAAAPVKEDSPCCAARIARALAGEAVSSQHFAMRHVLEFGLRPVDIQAGTGLWGKDRDGKAFGESERRSIFWMLNSKSQAIDLVCNEHMPEWFRYDGSEELFWTVVNDYAGAGGKAALVEKCIQLAESAMVIDGFPF